MEKASELRVSDEDRLRLLGILLSLTNVRVKLVRPVPEINTGMYRFKARSGGEVVSVPIWLAEILIDRGLAVITDETVRKISRNVWREYAQPRGESLAQIDKDFYPVARLYLHFLRKSGGKGLRPLAKEEDITKVLNKRLSIIMKLATLDVDTRVDERLTEEERLLLRLLRNVYRSWRSVVGI